MERCRLRCVFLTLQSSSRSLVVAPVKLKRLILLESVADGL